MNVGNWGHEMAVLRTETERDAGIAAARKSLKQIGSEICIACKEEIEPERRAVLPSAVRCMECQENYEQWQKKGSRF